MYLHVSTFVYLYVCATGTLVKQLVAIMARNKQGGVIFVCALDVKGGGENWRNEKDTMKKASFGSSTKSQRRAAYVLVRETPIVPCE